MQVANSVEGPSATQKVFNLEDGVLFFMTESNKGTRGYILLCSWANPTIKGFPMKPNTK